MDWKWIIGIAITLGTMGVGGIWTVVQLVAKLVGEATEIKVRLNIVVPVAQELPQVKQELAVTRTVVDSHADEIHALRDKTHEHANELAKLGASRTH